MDKQVLSVMNQLNKLHEKLEFIQSTELTLHNPEVSIIMDEGGVYPGVQKSFFKEFFLNMKYFKGRIIERMIWNNQPEVKVHWQTKFNFNEQIPYLLTKQERTQNDFVPPDGVSALPPEWEKKIKSEFRWWHEKSMGKEFSKVEKLEKMKAAYNDLIERGELTGDVLESDSDGHDKKNISSPFDFTDTPIQINFRGKTYLVNTSESGNGLILEKNP